MPEVYSLSRLLLVLMRTSIVHVGAAATSAALRTELVAAGAVDEGTFDEMFAAARITPGTNFIALFAALGNHVAGLPGALAAVTVGVAPAVVASMAVLTVYLRFGGSPQAIAAVSAASVAALSVLVWAGSRFAFAPWPRHRSATIAIAVSGVAIHQFGVSPVVLLLAAGIAGAIVFRDGPA